MKTLIVLIIMFSINAKAAENKAQKSPVYSTLKVLNGFIKKWDTGLENNIAKETNHFVIVKKITKDHSRYQWN